MKYVIVGNSAAGIGGIEGIRSVDRSGEIVMFTDEPYHTYSRPLISYYLQGKTDIEKMSYRPEGFYCDNNVRLERGVRVAAIDAENRRVVLDSGASESYDKLLLATGSRAATPPIDGLENAALLFHFLTLDDAKALKSIVAPNSRVLIVGAGLIGLKCAEGLSATGCSITVTDIAGRVLSAALDEGGASMVQRHMEQQGIRFRLNDRIAKIMKNRAAFAGGQHVDFDILVVAAGVLPNTELMCALGCDAKRGIRVDSLSQTEIPGIYAAGDCVRCCDISSGQEKIMAILPNAYLQGEAAGVNMAGGNKSFETPIPMNAVTLMGLRVISAGTFAGEEHDAGVEGAYKKLFVEDNLLKGYILIGHVERAGIYTSLITGKIPLDTIDFDLMKAQPQLMAFSRSGRQKMLGGQ